ncbi:MAG: hypothetical protein HY671_10605 [Chloroflexi bacterium]|nr:hypothetical protein [Chloroflexota bacterium]
MSDQPVPDIYADQFRLTTGVYGATMTFGISPAHPSAGQVAPPRDVVTVRMSMEHAKVMTLMLRRTLKQYERDSGVTIGLPQNLCAQLGLSLEDW